MIKATGKEKKKRGRQPGGLLLRPIVCICNDLYVPALRPLRQVALTINFPPTVPHKLATRLMEVRLPPTVPHKLATILMEAAMSA